MMSNKARFPLAELTGVNSGNRALVTNNWTDSPQDASDSSRVSSFAAESYLISNFAVAVSVSYFLLSFISPTLTQSASRNPAQISRGEAPQSVEMIDWRKTLSEYARRQWDDNEKRANELTWDDKDCRLSWIELHANLPTMLYDCYYRCSVELLTRLRIYATCQRTIQCSMLSSDNDRKTEWM